MQRLQSIIEQVFDTSFTSIDRRDDLKELDFWDSMNHMLLITGIEKDYDIILEAEEIIAMTSIETIETILFKKLEES